MTRLQRWAAAAPVSVFPAVGAGAAARVDEVGLAPDVELVLSPRHASILLVAGEPRADDRDALWRVHDQLPHPRATVCWGSEIAGLGGAVAVPDADDPRRALHALQRALVTGERSSEPDLLPDEPPNPWRGKGDFGQGGEGMMGGTPYGRMMPMPPQADLRDGLMLDAYTATVGPFLRSLPPGLVLEVTWQGDIVQSARVQRGPLEPPDSQASAFYRALAEPEPVAQLERTRAAHHLGCIARVLDLLELRRLAQRCRSAARRARRGDTVDAAALSKTLRRAGALAAVPGGLGRVPDAVAAELGGPARRAAGQAIDARAHQGPYEALGFETVSNPGGDARARVRQWIAEAAQALDLAERARRMAPAQFTAAVESPWGVLAASGRHEPAHVDLDFTELLIGREWHEALLILASFDAATLGRLIPWQPNLVPGTGGSAP